VVCRPLNSTIREEVLPLEVREYDRTPEGAPTPLVEIIRAHHAKVMDVRLDYARDERTYIQTEMSVGIQRLEELRQLEHAKVDDDAHDETPEEIALAVFNLATKHAQALGATKYRAVLMGMKQERYQKLDSCVFTIGIDYDTGRATVGETPIGREEVLELATTIAKDAHKHHMATVEKITPLLGQVVDLVGKVAEFTGPMAQAQVDLKKIDLELEEAKYESEDRRQAWRTSAAVLIKLMSVFGVQIAEFWRESGFPGAPPNPDDLLNDEPDDIDPLRVEQLGDLVIRWDQMFEKIPPAKLQKLSNLLGEDLAKLAEKMRTAKDDQMFRNMANELVTRAQQEPDYVAKLIQIKNLLGDEIGEVFASVLAEANQ
jgi:hypothetical protein